MAFIIDDIINYFIGKQAQDEERRAIEDERSAIAGLKLPEFDKKQYLAQMFDRPEEARSQGVSIDPKMREQQMAGLQQLLDRSHGLSDAQSDMSRFKAINQANQLASSRDQATLANAQARGVGGGGLEFALRSQGGQDAANRAQEAGLQGSQQAALEKLQAQSIYNQGLGNLRNQDTDLSSRNADIINRFNMYNVGNRNAANQANVQMGNQGQQYNLGRNDQNAMNSFNSAFQKQQLSSSMLNPKLQNIEAGAANNRGLTTGLFQGAANIASMGVGGAAGGFGGAMGALGMGQGGQKKKRYYYEE